MESKNDPGYRDVLMGESLVYPTFSQPCKENYMFYHILKSKMNGCLIVPKIFKPLHYNY